MTLILISKMVHIHITHFVMRTCGMMYKDRCTSYYVNKISEHVGCTFVLRIIENQTYRYFSFRLLSPCTASSLCVYSSLHMGNVNGLIIPPFFVISCSGSTQQDVVADVAQFYSRFNFYFALFYTHYHTLS